METVAKTVLQQPTQTFGQVLNYIRSRGLLNLDLVSILEKTNQLANLQFRHGTEFNLKPPEVDFTYLSCIAGILLFAQL